MVLTDSKAIFFAVVLKDLKVRVNINRRIIGATVSGLL